MDTEIYAIRQDPMGELYKVGYSKHPKQRMQKFQTANPFTLHLVATEPGGRVAEVFAHDVLEMVQQRHNLSGEWYMIPEFIDVEGLLEWASNCEMLLVNQRQRESDIIEDENYRKIALPEGLK